MIDICRNNDKRYDGIFYLAVKSTMIYCIPSCTAKFPKEKNISFYSDRDTVETAGYRGCMRCYSAERHFQPEWLRKIIIHLHNHIYDNLTMSDLEQVVSRHRSTIVTAFQDYYHCTAMQYYRKLKLQVAKRRVFAGDDYRDVAFDLGYQSISGFRSAFKAEFEVTPKQLLEAK